MNTDKTVTALAAAIRGMAPQFVVSDLEKSISFYTEELGFSVSFGYQDFYAGLECAGHSLHLKHGDPLSDERSRKRKDENLDVTFSVADVNGLYENILSKKINVIQPLRTMPYGKEFYICDPDGYILAFVEVAE